MSSLDCRWTNLRLALALTIVISALVASGSLAESPEAASDKHPIALLTFVPDPADNPTTRDKVALGKQLFFDPRLSGDNSMSCATCHAPDNAFADGLPQAKGHGDKTLARNTPTLVNVGFQSRLMWDGRVNSLEEQALLPIQSPEEMNQNLDELERELNAVPAYTEQFKRVFGSVATREAIAKALAAFERTLVMKPSGYDRYLQGDRDALSPAAERGRELFFGEAGCTRCHKGPLLSDGDFYRLGVSFSDGGRGEVTGKSEDKGKFKTPPLRNVTCTAPYMHDGSLKTLEDVVTFYYRSAPTSAADGHPLDIEPLLGRSYSEIADLVAFLESLTGEVPAIDAPKLP